MSSYGLGVAVAIIIGLGAISVAVAIAFFSEKSSRRKSQIDATESVDDEWSFVPSHELKEAGFELWRMIADYDSTDKLYYVYQDHQHQEVARQKQVDDTLDMGGQTIKPTASYEKNIVGWIKDGSTPRVEFNSNGKRIARGYIENFRSQGVLGYGGDITIIYNDETYVYSAGTYTQKGEMVGISFQPRLTSTKILYAFHPDLPKDLRILLMQARFATLLYFKAKGTESAM
jgi:hypothetical protein